MKKSIPLFFAAIYVFLPGCDIINPPEDIPSYLYIEHFQKVTTYVNEGSASHHITDAWVYVDDQPIGAFELPATVPVFSEGDAKISVLPGIKRNGISSQRTIYPYYQSENVNLSLSPATVDTLIPSTEYVTSAEFPLLEDFESGNEFLGMGITSNNSEVFEGNKSGKINLDVINDKFTVISDLYNLPGGGKTVYLELDYRNTEEFKIFLQFNNGGSYRELVTVTPKEVWHKIYVDLTEVVSSVGVNDFQVVFTGALPVEENTAEFLWDNIKIVHN